MKKNVKRNKQLHNCKTAKQINKQIGRLFVSKLAALSRENLKLKQYIRELKEENVKLNIRLSGSNAIQFMLKEELVQARTPWWKKVLRCQ
ncbi:hypothetical protein CS063_14995 [Sporanaerobium hydrogeniformans]|uniref:Uncharacterized protein n=1 Tax=Sporanaerobium hydrogeniformans TaxID=3072179 RepID=A0AC61D9V6_9FIRM|nr:hypothetical protein [Sporanaerobium hydrogeniformans]PHV69550.1 hypothetical protein CS063_14995 [Sporanaerobium hydrogeniformans]